MNRVTNTLRTRQRTRFAAGVLVLVIASGVGAVLLFWIDKTSSGRWVYRLSVEASKQNGRSPDLEELYRQGMALPKLPAWLRSQFRTLNQPTRVAVSDYVSYAASEATDTGYAELAECLLDTSDESVPASHLKGYLLAVSRLGPSRTWKIVEPYCRRGGSAASDDVLASALRSLIRSTRVAASDDLVAVRQDASGVLRELISHSSRVVRENALIASVALGAQSRSSAIDVVTSWVETDSLSPARVAEIHSQIDMYLPR